MLINPMTLKKGITSKLKLAKIREEIDNMNGPITMKKIEFVI